jgi:hypothetical protein
MLKDPFKLDIKDKFQAAVFKTQLLLLGYTHKFRVELNGEELIF